MDIQVSCVQAWFYFNNYPKDTWYIELLVCKFSIGGCCFGLRHHSPSSDFPYKCVDMSVRNGEHACLIAAQVYSYVITNFGNVVELGNIVWSVQHLKLGVK